MTVAARARRVAGTVVVLALAAGCGADRGEPSMVVTGAEPAPAPTAQATVVHVVDGDTFDVELPDGTEERIRPPQIDTPEVDECGYAESSAVLEELILGEVVELVRTSDGPNRDSYGRLLRAVELDGDDIGQLLVRAGLARWVPRYADEDRRLAAMYEAAERQAREQGAGLWAACAWS